MKNSFEVTIKIKIRVDCEKNEKEANLLITISVFRYYAEEKTWYTNKFFRGVMLFFHILITLFFVSVLFTDLVIM
jgi:hypothetical protein